MDQLTIASIYARITGACGFTAPPRLEFEPLGGRDVARFETLTVGRGFKASTVDQRIVVDPAHTSALDDMQVTAILAHELAHYICRYKTISGGDQSADGGWHGCRFLSAWLWVWKQLGRDAARLTAEAAWHAQAYNLPTSAMQRALKAALSSGDLDTILERARPAISRKDEVLAWLRLGGWMSLFMSVVALIRDMPVSAAIGAGMTIGCYVLITKFKRMPAAALQPAEG